MDTGGTHKLPTKPRREDQTSNFTVQVAFQGVGQHAYRLFISCFKCILHDGVSEAVNMVIERVVSAVRAAPAEAWWGGGGGWGSFGLALANPQQGQVSLFHVHDELTVASRWLFSRAVHSDLPCRLEFRGGVRS